jgi:surface antigen
LVAITVSCAYMAGCSMTGKGLGAASADAMTTAAISRAPATQDADLASDRLTVQNAVSSADLGNIASSDLSWANSATGSNGVVTSIAEKDEANKRCRVFQTTRTSYAGIAIHEGEICSGDDGLWWTRRFDPI